MRFYEYQRPGHPRVGGGGGAPLYKLCRYVPPDRVGFLRRFGQKTDIWFSRELRECMNVVIVLFPRIRAK